MERSYVNQIIPGKKLGVMLHGANDAGFTYGASVYQQDFNELTNQSPLGSQYALRLTGNLAKLAKISDSTVVHVGVGAVKGKYEQTAATSGNTAKTADTYTRSTIVSFRDENRGLANAYRLQIGGDRVTTLGYGVVGDGVVNIAQNMNGLELAVAQGPFKFQAEMANSKYNASTARCDYNTTSGSCTSLGTANVNATVKTNYLSFLWNVTGEDFGKSYANGSFGGIKPTSEFMKDYGGVVGNGTGAWQIGYRVSTYDVTSSTAVSSSLASGTLTEYSITDGSTTTKSRVQNSPTATTQTIALNWILNSNARIMFNYATTTFGSSVEYLDTDTNSTTTKREDIISVRTQFNF